MAFDLAKRNPMTPYVPKMKKKKPNGPGLKGLQMSLGVRQEFTGCTVLVKQLLHSTACSLASTSTHI